MAPMDMYWTKAMAKNSKTLVLGLSGLMFLSACAGRPIYSSFRSEAGALTKNDGFGLSTAHNEAVMTREMDYTIDLAERFNDEVNDTVNFAFNRWDLDETTRDILRVQADWIIQFPEVRFRVFGHTDKVGESAYNKTLGMKRARAVVAYLVELGVDETRLEAVISEGETKPLIDTEEREVRNRRAVTEVSGFVAGHPNLLDGKYAAVIYRDYVASATASPTIGGGSLGQ